MAVLQVLQHVQRAQLDPEPAPRPLAQRPRHIVPQPVAEEVRVQMNAMARRAVRFSWWVRRHGTLLVLEIRF